MKAALNTLLSFAFSRVLIAGGITPQRWEFWVLFALLLAIVTIQYMK